MNRRFSHTSPFLWNCLAFMYVYFSVCSLWGVCKISSSKVKYFEEKIQSHFSLSLELFGVHTCLFLSIFTLRNAKHVFFIGRVFRIVDSVAFLPSLWNWAKQNKKRTLVIYYLDALFFIFSHLSSLCRKQFSWQSQFERTLQL